MKNASLKARYERLKREVLALGPVCPGSVQAQLRPCGKPGCRCHQAKRYRHGPYYVWTRKLRGKTVSRALSEDEARQCQQWVQNNRKLRTWVTQMQALWLGAAPWAR